MHAAEGAFFQTHTAEQQSRDGGTGWSQQMQLGTSENLHNHLSSLGGDMPQRGIWTKVPGSSMTFSPYSQFSCAVGVANVYNVNDLKKLRDLTYEYGKIFIFTASSEELKKAVKADPDHFAILASQETWMYHKRPIWICASRTKKD